MQIETRIEHYMNTDECLECRGGMFHGEQFGDFCKCWVSAIVRKRNKMRNYFMDSMHMDEVKANILSKLAMMSAAKGFSEEWKRKNGPRRTENFSSL